MTLKCFAGLLGWDSKETISVSGARTMPHYSGKVGKGSWTTTTGSTAGKSTADVKMLTRTLDVLALFLEVGLLPSREEMALLKREEEIARVEFPLWQAHLHLLGQESNPYGYLNLFGAPRDEEGMEYEDRVDRLRYFNERWKATFLAGTERVKKEGGGVGRVAVAVDKMLKAG